MRARTNIRHALQFVHREITSGSRLWIYYNIYHADSNDKWRWHVGCYVKRMVEIKSICSYCEPAAYA